MPRPPVDAFPPIASGRDPSLFESRRDNEAHLGSVPLNDRIRPDRVGESDDIGFVEQSSLRNGNRRPPSLMHSMKHTVRSWGVVGA